MRRTRFTVYLPSREPFVVLAYQERSVLRAYPGAAVERGDFRRRERTERARRTQPTFTIDHAAVREAIDVLGVRWPVTLTTSAKLGGTLGNHSLRFKGGSVRHSGGRIHNIATATDVFHRVMVKTHDAAGEPLSARRAGEVIWHELCHAMQAERETKGVEGMMELAKTWNTCHARGVGRKYATKPIEVEAREFEAWNNDHPLALDSGSRPV